MRYVAIGHIIDRLAQILSVMLDDSGVSERLSQDEQDQLPKDCGELNGLKTELK